MFLTTIRFGGYSGDKIPAAFIITGTNIASQNLLFEQLAESLQGSSHSKFVRFRSSEATNLKATLKKIIRDVTNRSVEDEEDEDDGLQVARRQTVSCLPSPITLLLSVRSNLSLTACPLGTSGLPGL